MTVAQEVDTVTAVPDTVVMEPWDTVQVTISILDANGFEVAGVVPTVSSSDSSVAVADSAGLITGVADGVAVITVSASGKSAAVTVIVERIAVSVAVTPVSATLTAIAATERLTAQVLDRNDSVIATKSIAWSSSDEQVVTVDTTGLIAAVANGAAFVYAEADAVRDSASVTVAQAVDTVVVTPDTLGVETGGTGQFTAVGRDANDNPMSGLTFAWSLSDSSSVSIDATGLVTAGTSADTVRVDATADGKTGSAVLIITLAVDDVRVTPNGASISGVGSAFSFTAEARSGGVVVPGKSFTWTSLNPNVAIIDANSGLVTAVASGQVTIKAEVDGVVGYALLTVLV